MHISDGSMQEEKPSMKMVSPKVVRYFIPNILPTAFFILSFTVAITVTTHVLPALKEIRPLIVDFIFQILHPHSYVSLPKFGHHYDIIQVFIIAMFHHLNV